MVLSSGADQFGVRVCLAQFAGPCRPDLRRRRPHHRCLPDFSLGDGAIGGEYPYDLLDAKKFGYLQVGIGTGVLVLAVAVFCLLLVAIDKWLGRRRGA